MIESNTNQRDIGTFTATLNESLQGLKVLLQD